MIHVPGDLPAEQRAAAFASLDSPFDVIVVGGGCNGCGIAWEAALRGMRVLLLEKEDFGWATSAWNSRLIHGGLKYLEKADVRLVRESLREREWMLHAAPHLVRPLEFVLPFYARNDHSAAALRLGMVAYDVLSWDKSTPRHRVRNRQASLALVPGLDRDGLGGSAAYFDLQVNYAERLTVETALAARRAGAIVLNHARVESLVVDRGLITGVSVVDSLTGAEHTARSGVVINAAGPWVDQVLGGLDGPPRAPLMGGTKGTHLVVDPFPGAPTGVAMFYQAVTDGRPMLVIPWLGRYLVGATDVRFSGDLDTASSDDEEVAYILRETNLVLPGASLRPDDILWRYTGVRPLPFQEDGPTGDITRRHVVHDHAPEGLRGLFSIIGGKLTTFRALAQHVVDDVVRARRPVADRRLRVSHSRVARLPGAQIVDFAAYRRDLIASSPRPAIARRLVDIYGTRAQPILAMIAQHDELGRVVDEESGVTAAELAFALSEESAVTLADVVARRVMTGLDASMGLDSLQDIGRAVQSLAGWSDEQLGREIDGYHDYVAKFHPRAISAR